MVSRKIAIALSLCLLSSCATISQGSHQDITVSTAYDKNGVKTRCNLKNEEGTWNGPTDTNINIHRDGNNMEIQCENDKQTGVSYVDPNFDGSYLFLDALLDFCILSCIVDGVNNSFYRYPSLVTVHMKEKYPRYDYDQSVTKLKEKLSSIQEYMTNVCRPKEYDEDYIGCLNQKNDEIIAASFFPDLTIKMFNTRKEFEQQLIRKEITREELREHSDKLNNDYYNQVKERAFNDINAGVYKGKI